MTRIRYTGESHRRTDEVRRQMANKEGHRSGGRVQSYDYPEMESGSRGANGRLEKIAEYGRDYAKSAGKDRR